MASLFESWASGIRELGVNASDLAPLTRACVAVLLVGRDMDKAPCLTALAALEEVLLCVSHRNTFTELAVDPEAYCKTVMGVRCSNGAVQCLDLIGTLDKLPKQGAGHAFRTAFLACTQSRAVGAAHVILRTMPGVRPSNPDRALLAFFLLLGVQSLDDVSGFATKTCDASYRVQQVIDSLFPPGQVLKMDTAEKIARKFFEQRRAEPRAEERRQRSRSSRRELRRHRSCSRRRSDECPEQLADDTTRLGDVFELVQKLPTVLSQTVAALNASYLDRTKKDADEAAKLKNEVAKEKYELERAQDRLTQLHVKTSKIFLENEQLLVEMCEAARGVVRTFSVKHPLPEELAQHCEKFHRASEAFLLLPGGSTSQFCAAWEKSMDGDCPLKEGMGYVESMNVLTNKVIPELEDACEQVAGERRRVAEERETLLQQKTTAADRDAFEFFYEKGAVAKSLAAAFPQQVGLHQPAEPAEVLSELLESLGKPGERDRSCGLLIRLVGEGFLSVHRAVGGSEETLRLLREEVGRRGQEEATLLEEDPRFATLPADYQAAVRGLCDDAARRGQSAALNVAERFVVNRHDATCREAVQVELANVSRMLSACLERLGSPAGEAVGDGEESEDSSYSESSSSSDPENA